MPLFANIMQALSFGLHLKGAMDPDLDPQSAMAAAVDLHVAGMAAREPATCLRLGEPEVP